MNDFTEFDRLDVWARMLLQVLGAPTGGTQGDEVRTEEVVDREKFSQVLLRFEKQLATFDRQLIPLAENLAELKEEVEASTEYSQRFGRDLDRLEQLFLSARGTWEHLQQCLRTAKQNDDPIAIQGSGKSMSTIAQNIKALRNGIDWVRFGFEEVSELPTRLEALDDKLLSHIVSRKPFVTQIRFTDDQLKPFAPTLSQLVLVTKYKSSKLNSLLTGITTKKKAQQAIESMRKSGLLGSDTVNQFIQECHELVNQVFRFWGDLNDFESALAPNLRTKWQQAREVANLDRTLATAAYTGLAEVLSSDPSEALDQTLQIAPTVRPKPLIGVAGGGPIGLMSSIQAKLKGADVIVFEGRGGDKLHTRMNVLKLDPSTTQQFKRLGIYERLPRGAKGEVVTEVPVKRIEEAALARAQELGVVFHQGEFVQEMEKAESGKVQLSIFDADEKVEVDLLIVAVGSGVARPNKYANNVVMADQLGITIEKRDVRDYAVTSIYEQDSQDPEARPERRASPEVRSNWSYRFNVPDVDYVVTQLTEDEFERLQQNPAALREWVRNIAANEGITKKMMADPLAFPIDIQQAQQFVSTGSNAVLIGDSAATPHPDTSMGLNVGASELDVLGDVISELGSSEEPQEQDESQRKATARYEWELQKRTDYMLLQAVISMHDKSGKKTHRTMFDLKSSLRALKNDDRDKQPLLDLANRVQTEKIDVYRREGAAAGAKGNVDLTEHAITQLREIGSVLTPLFRNVRSSHDRTLNRSQLDHIRDELTDLVS